MQGIIVEYTKTLPKWFHDLNLLSIAWTIIVALVLCRLSRSVVKWVISRIIKESKKETKLAKIERRKRTKTLANLFTFIVNLLIALTAVYATLTNLGVNLAPVIASAGIVGVALGFGAQTLVRDMLAGFFILFENQYRVDDVIRVSGTGFPTEPVEGTVKSITLRKTMLRDREGNVHIIPNGAIVEVTNRTLGFSKFRFIFAVDVDTDVNAIIRIINEVGDGMTSDDRWSKIIVDAPHYDEFGRIGKQGINVTVSGTTIPGKQWDVSAEFRKRLVTELQKSDITIADVES